jgi:hypothetical protein
MRTLDDLTLRDAVERARLVTQVRPPPAELYERLELARVALVNSPVADMMERLQRNEAVRSAMFTDAATLQYVR